MKKFQQLLVGAWILCVGVVNAEDAFKREEVKGQGFKADFYYQESKPKNIGIIVLGGADGGVPDFIAGPVVGLGYPVLSLAYFKAEGTPEYLDMIPLEYFDKPIKWFLTHEKVKVNKIIILGSSKGTELGLLLASEKPDISGVIGYSPSSVVFQGIPKEYWPPKSSWSLNGKPVNFVPYDQSKPYDQNDRLGMYERTLQQKDKVEAALIPVEKINGPVLLISGNDDQVWPSKVMGDRVCDRIKEKKGKFGCEHIKYDNAGHTLTEHYMMGGTFEGNRKARLESLEKISQFINKLSAE